MGRKKKRNIKEEVGFDVNKCVNTAFVLMSNLYYFEIDEAKINYDIWTKSCDIEEPVKTDLENMIKRVAEDYEKGKIELEELRKNFDVARGLIMDETWKKVRKVLGE